MFNPRMANSWDELVLVRKNFPDVVFYHSPCPDGYTARWVMQSLFDRLNTDFRYDVSPEEFDDIEFVPYNYEHTLPSYEGKHVLFVDCSPASTTLMGLLLAECASVTVLDHHKTAIERLSTSFESIAVHSVYEHQPWNTRSGLYCLFDVKHSGAKLTYKYFLDVYYDSLYALFIEHGGKSGGLQTTRDTISRLRLAQSCLVNYVSDRDTWKFEHPNSKEVNEYLLSLEYTHEAYNDAALMLVEQFDTVVQLGITLRNKRLKDTKELLPIVSMHETVEKNDEVWHITYANMPYMLVSDAADLVCTSDNHLFVAYYIDKNDKFVVSLRSRGTKLDVAALAAKYGGGGHFNAAGCKMSINPSHLVWLEDNGS